MIKKTLIVFICNILLICSTPSWASESESTCPDAEILGAGLIDKLCWDCVLPIVLFGQSMGGGSRPDASTHNIACTCDVMTIPTPGFTAGYRAMSRIMEVVRDPQCSPFLGGIKLLNDDSLLKGSPVRAVTDDGDHKIYMNTNSWSFPVLYLIEVLLDKNCTGDTGTINLIGMSSFSPTWANDELAFHLNPEAAVVANPEFMFFGMADGLMVTANPDGWGNSQTRDTWFWTIGTWSGSIYPLTGSVSHAASPPRETALVAARSLALSHRIGQERLTMGAGNLCGGAIYPFLPKTQYKFSQVFPQAQASAPCCNQLGESTFKWNEWRNIPGYEDYIYMVFRWVDCCITLF